MEGPAQSTIDVMVPGGTAKGMRQTYPGVPQLVTGKQYVLFLWKSSKGATYPMGFTQGVFNLLQDASGNTAAQMPTTVSVAGICTGRDVARAVRQQVEHALGETHGVRGALAGCPQEKHVLLPGHQLRYAGIGLPYADWRFRRVPSRRWRFGPRPSTVPRR